MKKISLKKETIRKLKDKDLQSVNGGISQDSWCSTHPLCLCNTSEVSATCATDICPTWGC